MQKNARSLRGTAKAIEAFVDDYSGRTSLTKGCSAKDDADDGDDNHRH